MRLKQIMAETGVTQQQVAGGIGVSAQAMNHYIHGRREPDIETLIKLADYFGVSVDYLIGRDVPEEKPTAGQVVELDPSKPVVIRAGNRTFEIHLAEDTE